MKMISAAAAFAAGMMISAACAQEAPALSQALSGTAAPAGTTSGPAGQGRSEVATVSVTFADRGMIAVEGTAVERAVVAAPPAEPPAKTPAARQGGEPAARAKSGNYGDIIARYAAAYGVPVSLAHAVIRIESNYRVNARGRAGEVGLMQIKPATARGLGYSGSTAALYHPENNIKYGMKYLGMAHRLGGGTTCGTILKYNAGHGAKRMNPVSAAYCAKVKRKLGA